MVILQILDRAQTVSLKYSHTEKIIRQFLNTSWMMIMIMMMCTTRRLISYFRSRPTTRRKLNIAHRVKGRISEVIFQLSDTDNSCIDYLISPLQTETLLPFRTPLSVPYEGALRQKLCLGYRNKAAIAPPRITPVYFRPGGGPRDFRAFQAATWKWWQATHCQPTEDSHNYTILTLLLFARYSALIKLKSGGTSWKKNRNNEISIYNFNKLID